MGLRYRGCLDTPSGLREPPAEEPIRDALLLTSAKIAVEHLRVHSRFPCHLCSMLLTTAAGGSQSGKLTEQGRRASRRRPFSDQPPSSGQP